MAEHILRQHPLDRPEYLRALEPSLPDIRLPDQTSRWHRLTAITPVRQVTLLLILAAAWQIYASALNNPLILPSFAQTAAAFWSGIFGGELLLRAWTSVELLLAGYAIALVLSVALTLLAVSSRLGADLLTLLTSMFNPLPAIALLPLALLWFGLGEKSLLFVLVHSVIWPLALNTYAGFRGVGETLRMTGHSFGLRGLRYAFAILFPAAFPSILTGLKIGWAFAWRTLIAAELVFGVSSGSGGLGWYIYENRNQLETANVFAGLLTVILIGLAVESLIFRVVERITVRRWGMYK